MEASQPTPTVQTNAAAAASTPPPVQQEQSPQLTLSTFDQRRDLQYLEKLTCRVLAALQTFGTADLDTISNCVKADPKAVAEVLDVLYATPLVTLERPSVVVSDESKKTTTVLYKYAQNLYGLDTINPSSFQEDYARVLQQANQSIRNTQVLEAAIAKREQEILLATPLEQPAVETGDEMMELDEK